ncbi:MAG: sortase [Aggregatilineales bacterium]
MHDKRPVDELTIAELERILAIRKREARQVRLERYAERRVLVPAAPIPEPRTVAIPHPIPLENNGLPAILPQVQTADPTTDDPIALDAEPQFEDEFGLDSRRGDANGRSQRSIWWNRALTGVEILAVVGLGYLLVTLFVSLQAVTQTTANIQASFQATSQAQIVPPTATPTINIASVVLPGGHVYSADASKVTFNLDEIPAQYRAVYQSQVLDLPSPVAPPTASPAEPLTIHIPAIGVQSAVVSGDAWNDLQRGVGHHLGSANPGELGNMVLAGHDDVFGSVFKDLYSLKPGDEITVATQVGSYTYIVQGHTIVEPTDLSVLDNSRHDSARITLITCYPYEVDTRRWVVYGTLRAS